MSPARKSIILMILAAVLFASAAWWVYPKLLRRFYHHGLRLVTVAEGLGTPWAFVFLPDGRLLVTERIGSMRIVERDGRVGEPIAGLPPIHASGEGGLLDVTLDPKFAENGMIYWSYSEPAADGRGGASTAVARGRLEMGRIANVQVIFRQREKVNDGLHFGSRLLFAPDGRLLVTLGDRSRRPDAQRLDSDHGKILRIEPDGGIPGGNPFAGRSPALGAIWSYGHRNVQGIAFRPGSGELWASEHGPNGGDEINLIVAGRNYGWPVITYGCEYRTCNKIGDGTEKAGMEQPVTWWGPKSLPLSAMTFVTGDRYPAWKGQLLVGVLVGPGLVRIDLDGHKVRDRELLFLGKYSRVRDVKQGPDGWLYVAVNRPDGRILRLER